MVLRSSPSDNIKLFAKSFSENFSLEDLDSSLPAIPSRTYLKL